MKTLEKTPRTTVKRMPKRASYDSELLNQIIDEALICHIGFNYEGCANVIPTVCWRIGNELFMHFSRESRLATIAKKQQEICVELTILDGLVLAQTAFHHSVNFRSAIIYGTPKIIESPGEKNLALKQMIEHFAPGRWQHTRIPNKKELAATLVFCISLNEASIKTRSGEPNDTKRDMELNNWAGTIPVKQVFGPMKKADYLAAGIEEPDYSCGYEKRWLGFR